MCDPGNSSGILRVSGWVLIRLSGCQGGEVKHGNFWLGVSCGNCFIRKGSMGIGGFQVIVEVIKGVYFIEN